MALNALRVFYQVVAATAYSIQSALARLSVSAPVNHAPVLDISGNPILPTITEDDTNNSGVVIGALVGTSITRCRPR